MEDRNIEVAVNYEKCRVLISLMANTAVLDSDRETLAWILEEYFNRLGEAIGQFQPK